MRLVLKGKFDKVIFVPETVKTTNSYLYSQSDAEGGLQLARLWRRAGYVTCIVSSPTINFNFSVAGFSTEASWVSVPFKSMATAPRYARNIPTVPNTA